MCYLDNANRVACAIVKLAIFFSPLALSQATFPDIHAATRRTTEGLRTGT